MATKGETMNAKDVIELYDLFKSNGITVWIDGGWGVDALLERQTRHHEDLDIALRHSDVPKLRKLLEDRGYRDVPRDDTRDCNFVLGDRLGHQVDIHSFELDANGNNIFGCEYRAQHLTGTGIIGGHGVNCIPPPQIVEFHTGYKLDENDALDVKALCEKFNIEMPEDHKKYWQKRGCWQKKVAAPTLHNLRFLPQGFLAEEWGLLREQSKLARATRASSGGVPEIKMQRRPKRQPPHSSICFVK
jgi:lincosamide nucleotidyltransferase A/C/D/E